VNLVRDLLGGRFLRAQLRKGKQPICSSRRWEELGDEEYGTQEMRPETFARFERHCVFNKLGYEDLKRIAELHLGKCLALINAQGHRIAIGSGVVEYVQREGYSEQFGVRPMQNAAMQVLRPVVSREKLQNGGRPACGVVEYDRQANRCFLVPDPNQ
jgi:ATP-dependent Clp protease ATP-binding subunit ClpA